MKQLSSKTNFIFIFTIIVVGYKCEEKIKIPYSILK